MDSGSGGTHSVRYAADSYEKLLGVVNRKKEKGKRTVCECGKEIFVAQLEKHRGTGLHAILMFKKQKKEQLPTSPQ